nr:hypothetical protein [uncultured Brevundimonas sp.]
MSDIDTPSRKPGPWDAQPAELRTPEPAVAPAVAERTAEKDQSLILALASTALMGGFLWWISGSAVVAGAVLIGLFVHEAGHAWP